MKQLLSLLLMLLFVGIMQSEAQTGGRKITGVVVDSIGDAVIGATVTEKGRTTNATSTDAAGQFSLLLRGTTNRIVISSVNYQPQEVAITTADNLRVRMIAAKAESTDEVVVVGYGRKKAITNTGSVSSISGAALRENPSASVQNTLAGRLPGFSSQQTSGRPGADGATFYIRGTSSYNTGSSTPLIIVDDIEYTYEQFSRIDPNEIETLSILKDASTTAVYGVRGANGVLIITTRRGKNGPPQISFRGETSIQQPTILPHYLNAYESAKLVSQAQTNDGIPAISNTRIFTQADLDTFRDGSNPYTHPDVNWREILFKNFSQQYRGNFDISGGTDRVKYFVSAGYLFQNGMLKNYGSAAGVNNSYYNQRYNYRSNLDIKATATTDVRVDLYGNISEINQPQVGSPSGYNDLFYDYGSFLTLSPFAYPVYNPDGSFGYSDFQRATSPKSTALGLTNTYAVNNVVGRLSYLGYTRTFENNMNLVGTITQRLDFITKGLGVKGTISYASNYGDPGANGAQPNTVSLSGGAFPSYIYTPSSAANLSVGTYVPRDINTYRVAPLGRSYATGATYRSIQAQGFITYDRTFQNRHHFNGLILYNQNTVSRYSNNPIYNFIPNNLLGLTVRAGYDFKQKYLVEFNGARNGSDRFSANNRYGIFMAGSAGWNISEEKFFKNNVKFVDRLKLRGSYGLTGNDKLGSNFTYYYQQSYYGGGNVYFGNPSANTGSGIYEGTLGNLLVSWEKEKKLDLAIEGALFRSKLSFVVDYFNNNRYDILTDRSGGVDSRWGSVSQVFGQSLPPVNLGRVNNKGIEVELNWADQVGKDFSYAVKGTYSYAKNTILYADEPTYKYGYQAYTGHSNGLQRVYTFIGFYDSASLTDPKIAKPTSGAKAGDLKYADLNGDGVIDGFDQKVQGYSNVPQTVAGIQLSVRYKNFNFGVFFQGAAQFSVRAASEAIQAFSSNLLPIHQQAWTPELGDNAKYPRLTINQQGISSPIANPSTFWLLPGDYIRLKTAEIGYALPNSWVSKLKMKNIRIYSNGYNLFTWTKLSKLYQLDPEITTNTARTVYPPQRIINFGVSATF